MPFPPSNTSPIVGTCDNAIDILILGIFMEVGDAIIIMPQME
jgi:hypothetical protein